jgi:hypothetical protein
VEPGRQEVAHNPGDLVGPLEKEQVPAPAHHVEPCVGDEASKDSSVGERDDRIVVAAEDQGRVR